MVNLTIDNKQVCVPEGTTILNAAKTVGIKIPTLCYLEDKNEIGACRVCVVEIEGKDRLVASCNTDVEEGMVVYTNSEKATNARKMNVALILSEHEARCPSCARNGNCSLQSISAQLNTRDMADYPFEVNYDDSEWPKDFPLIRNNSKCIKCMRCIQICDKVQSLSIWDVSGTGKHTTVGVKDRKSIFEADCAACGQCITHCPVGALTERDDTGKLMNAIRDPEKIVVVQIAPAVRSAWGEGLGITKEMATEKRMAAAVRALGVDYVFDTNFSADLTIMEEGSELLERLAHKDEYSWPMFTSCCPGWVRFIKTQYPDMTKNLSSAKSPQQMFGAVAKSYYAKLLNTDPNNIYSVSIMPCVAKKAECAIPVMNDAGAGQDVDLSLTTRELDNLLRKEIIPVASLDEEEFDLPLGIGTGAGVIFGATGGVMEAALRTAAFLVEGKNPAPDAFKAVRGLDGIKEATVTLGGTPIRAAIASGLGNARTLVEKIRNGEAEYEFVEIMACPGGCAGGGGQPIHDGEEHAGDRGDILYNLDEQNPLRFSHENPSITQVYQDFFEKPLSPLAHHLLHTDHDAWDVHGDYVK